MRNVKEKRGIFIMKQKAMDMKLVVKPLVGCLTHTHFWEGPCRAGHKEDMTVEAETKAADEAFKNSVKGLQGVIDEVEFTEPVDVRYNESFVVDKDLFAKIGASSAWDGEFLSLSVSESRSLSGRTETKELILQHTAVPSE